MSSWVYGLEDKKGSRGQSEGKSQEKEGCRREEEEEENIIVSLTTPEQGASREHCPFEGC